MCRSQNFPGEEELLQQLCSKFYNAIPILTALSDNQSFVFFVFFFCFFIQELNENGHILMASIKLTVGSTTFAAFSCELNLLHTYPD